MHLHHELLDRRLWVLLARINNLSEKTNRSGQPIAVLKRGQKLILPTAEQKAVFLRQLVSFEEQEEALPMIRIKFLADDHAIS